MNTLIPISADMKVSALVDSNPELMGVLTRMGLPFGFGEQTVAQACEAQGVDAYTFVVLCNVYAIDGYRIPESQLDKVRVPDLVKYLRASHSYYLKTALVQLSESIERLMEPCSESHRKVIWKFFSDYKDELGRHFQFEENEVLPYVEKLISDGPVEDYCIEDFEETHNDIDEKIDDLKNLVMKALPAECGAEERQGLLYFLYYLRRDLARHTSIEDNLLVPVVRAIESSRQQKDSRGGRRRNDDLSEREKEILVAVARGKLNKEIADEHCISVYTVISHRKNITRKTGIKTVAGLTVYALLNGLIDINTIE